jgi:predicted DNA-binding transcriptional regulator AlpA
MTQHTPPWEEYFRNHPEILASWAQQNGRAPRCECQNCSLLNSDQVAQRAGINRRTLNAYISRGRCGVPPHDHTTTEGGKVRKLWRESTINPWIARRKKAAP